MATEAELEQNKANVQAFYDIVEHWDVLQVVSEHPANVNGMF